MFDGKYWLIILLVLFSWNVARADSFYNTELADEITKHAQIDSAEVFTFQIGSSHIGAVRIVSEVTFNISARDVQRIADYSVHRYRKRYPQASLITFDITGEMEGLLHTIRFEARISGSAVRGEVTCSDPRCSSEAVFQSPYTS